MVATADDFAGTQNSKQWKPGRWNPENWVFPVADLYQLWADWILFALQYLMGLLQSERGGILSAQGKASGPTSTWVLTGKRDSLGIDLPGNLEVENVILDWNETLTSQPLEVTPEYKAERKRASEGRRMEKKGGEQTCQESPLEGNRYGRKRGPENCAMPWHKHVPPAGRPCHQPRPPVDIPLTAMHPVVERHLYVSVTDSNMPKFYFPAHGKYL